MLTDCGLLAEVISKQRKEFLKHFKLDMTHFISLPQLAYEALLLMTGVRIELVHDPDMILMLERSM